MAEALRKHREDLLCLVVLALAALATLSPVLISGQIPVDTSPLGNFPPWEHAFDAPGAGELSPALRYDLPNYLFIAEGDLKDRGLLWNPLEFGGVPFLGAWRTRCLSPFTLPFYLTTFEQAYQISLVMKLLCAGFAAFFAGRRLGLTAPFSLMAALSFQLSAHLTLYPLSPSSDVLVWFPLLFVFLERLALGHLAHWATGAATISLMVLGGSPEMLAGSLTLGFVYLAIRLALRRDRIRPLPSLLVYLATVAVAAALTAAQWLAFVEFRMNVALTEPLRDHPPLAIVHLGLVNVLLAGVWLSMRQHIATMPRRRIDCTILVSGLVLLFTLASGPLWTLLPVSLQLEPHHIIGGIGFILSIGAAAASEAWLELSPNQCRSVLRRLGVVAPVLLLPAVLVSLLPFESPTLAIPDSARLAFTGGLCAVFALVFGITLVRPSVRIMGYGMAALAAAELAVSLYPLRTLSPIATLYPETSTVLELRDAGLVSGGSVLGRWPLAGNGVRQVYGTGPYIPDSYVAWQAEADMSSVGVAPSAMLFFGAEGVDKRLANVRHLLHLAEVFPEGVARFRFDDARGEIEFVLRDSGNPQSETALADANAPSLKVVENFNAKLKVLTSSPSSETLVIWRSEFPGWIAEVDGVRAGFPALHGPYRSINLAPGDHSVTLRYRPAYLAVGLWISGVSVLVLAAGYLNLWRQRFALRQNAVRVT